MRFELRPVHVSFAAVLAAVLLSSVHGVSAAGRDTVVIPIDGTIDEGMAHMVTRAIDDANASNAREILLDVNTPGGLVLSAFEIRDALFRAKAPTVAYISRRAFSAGALVALAADRIEMAPGSSIGAAEPIPKTEKTVSALRAEFASTALRNHRDPLVAAAMVDSTVDLPNLKRPGAILSLTANEAVRAKIADGVVETQSQVLSAVGVADSATRVATYTLGERLARFATSPEVSGVLLAIGIMGLLIELQTLHGIAGLTGILALGVFFGTHVYAGFSDPLVVALGVVGVLGILFELHVLPGHGFAGLFGSVALFLAIVLSFGYAFFFVAAQAISIAIVLCAVALWLSARLFPENAFFKRMTLTSFQGSDYVTSGDYRSLLGQEGVASSYLRPAGVALIDGKRVDVLTEGEFVQAGSSVRVARVEGARIFVAPLSRETS